MGRKITINLQLGLYQKAQVNDLPVSTHLQQKKNSGIVIAFFLDSKKAVYVSYSIVIIC